MGDVRYRTVPQNHVQQIFESDHYLTKNDTFSRDVAPASITDRCNSKSVRSISRIWWLEISFMIVMLKSFVAMIITDLKYFDTTILEWPYALSINTLHAIYSVIFKGSITVVVSAGLSQLKWSWYRTSRPLGDIEYWDQASRGPWGSLLLIWRLRGRHIIGTIGALIIILTLALDPFVQLLLFHDACWTHPDGEQALVPIRNYYREEYISSNGYSIVPALRNAATTGFLGAPVASVQPTCGTGNCTFDEPYHSIAFCGDCRDISESTIVKYNPPNGTYGSHPWTTYNLPGGINKSIAINGGGSRNAELFAVIQKNFWVIVLATNLTQPTQPQDNPDLNCTDRLSENTWRCRTYGAANCTIKPCVKTYNATIENSSFNESTVGEFQSLLYDDSGWAAVNVKCLPRTAYDQLLQRRYPLNNSLEWIGYQAMRYYYNTWLSRINDVTQLRNLSLKIPAECIYSMSQSSFQPAQEYILNITAGNVDMDERTDQIGLAIPRFLLNRGNTSFSRIDNAFSQAALAMTNYLRQAQYPEYPNGSARTHAPARGIARQLQTCVHIRWPYLAYPATLVVMTLVFFAAMVHETWSHDSECDWKDSSLALVFHGILNNTQNAEALENVSVDTKGEMNQVADKLYVRFTTEEEEQR